MSLSIKAAQTGARKRKADNLGEGSSSGPVAKVIKVASIFMKKTASDSESSAFRWVPLGTGKDKSTLLHGVHLAPTSRTKVAAFDLDGTLIKSSFGKGIPKAKDPLHWEWWRSGVPAKLKELVEDGFSVVIISNQGVKPAQLVEWKKKIPLIAAAIPDVPFRIMAATDKDFYRKPMPGMWYELERLFAEDGVTIDKEASFFVGDAAGRAGDFAATDRKWAINVAIPFSTPEEFFLKLPAQAFTLPGFHVSSLGAPPPATGEEPPIIPASAAQELVLLVGPPALGKTTFFRRHFAPRGYAHVNQDALRTRDRCVREARKALAEGRSVVVDNTNRDAATRKLYLAVARELKIPARCFLFTDSLDLARHNNLYRAYLLPPSTDPDEPPRERVPDVAFTSFKGAYEAPTAAEGFAEVRRVVFVFAGDAAARARWGMWLQVSGK